MDTVTIDELAPHVRRITLNRPERLNALDYALAGALHDALDEVGSDPECRVLVLTGAGRGFCSGLDLQDFGQPPSPGTHRRADAGTSGQAFLADLPVHIRSTPQIVVAAVNGPAFGGGLSLALAADLRIAARSATFCSAFIKTGLTGTDIGVTYLLPRLIGASRAFDLIVTGRTVAADEADRLGLVSRVVDDAALEDATRELATQIASYTKLGLFMTKEVMWANLDTPNLATAIALENRNQIIASQSSEVRDYMRAYSQRHRAKPD